MREKIEDISPPSRGKRDKREPRKKAERPKSKPNKVSFFKRPVGKIGIGVLVLLLLVAGLWFSRDLYSKVKVTIFPHTTTREFAQEIQVNINRDSPDFVKKIIPGKLFKKEVEGEKTLKTTGEKTLKEKAKGVITVYNSHSPARRVRLVENTRFLSSEGSKTFRAQEEIDLPPASSQGGEMQPATTTIRVVAENAGENYNIAPSKFSIPGLSGSALYYSIWAESDSSMKGGSRKKKKIATKEDIKKAKQALKNHLKEKARQSLKKRVPKDYILRKGALMGKNYKVSCDKKQGELGKKITCEGDLKVKGLAIKSYTLRQLAMDIIPSRLPSSAQFDKEDIQINPKIKGKVSKNENTKINLQMDTKVYEDISPEVVQTKISGLKQKIVKGKLFNIYPQIKKIKLSFWPFWVSSAPSDTERIQVKIVP